MIPLSERPQHPYLIKASIDAERNRISIQVDPRIRITEAHYEELCELMNSRYMRLPIPTQLSGQQIMLESIVDAVEQRLAAWRYIYL